MASELSALSDIQRYQVTLHTVDAQGVSAEVTLRLPEVYGKRLTVSFPPATAADEALVQQFGGYYNVPANLLHVRPAIKLDGQVLAQGSRVVAIGQGHFLVVDFLFPGFGLVDRIFHTIFAGGYYAVGLDTVGNAEHVLRQRGLTYKARLNTLPDYSSDDQGIGDKLSIVAMRYLDTVEHQTVQLGALLWNVQVKDVAEALTSQDIRIEFVEGVLRFRPIGWTVDAKRAIQRHFAVDGDESDRDKKWRTMGLTGSYLENRLWEEQMGIPSVSTVNALQFANQVGIPILTIDQSNIAALLPTLNVSPNVRQAVVHAVNAGRVVTIPQDTLFFDEWVGSVWIDDLPGGLSTGYLISGSVLGGSNRQKPIPGENPTCQDLGDRLGNDVAKAIALFESDWTQFDRNGRPVTSEAGATGIMQIVPGCCPNLRVGGQPVDYPRTQTDWAYNVDAGNKLIGDITMRIDTYTSSQGINLSQEQFLTELYFQYNSGGFRVPSGGKRAVQVFNFTKDNAGNIVENNFSQFSAEDQAALRESQKLATNGREGVPPLKNIVAGQLWNDPSIPKGCK